MNWLRTEFGTGLLFAANCWLMVLVGLIALPTSVRDHVRAACQRWAHPESPAVVSLQPAAAEALSAPDRSPEGIPSESPAPPEPQESLANEPSPAPVSTIVTRVHAPGLVIRGEGFPMPRIKRYGTETPAGSPAPDVPPMRRSMRR